MKLKEMSLGEARVMGLTDQIVGLDDWPNAFRLVVTLPQSSDIVSPSVPEIDSATDIVSLTGTDDANPVNAGTASGISEGSNSDEPNAS